MAVSYTAALICNWIKLAGLARAILEDRIPGRAAGFDPKIRKELEAALAEAERISEAAGPLVFTTKEADQ